MRCVFAGTPDVAAVSLQALLASQHEVAAVITRPDAPVGRGRSLQASPVAAMALDAGIEVLRPASARDGGLLARLAGIAPDCCPVVAYGGLIPADLLAVPPLGWVNLHFSLLPAWRGAAPVQHSIWHGDHVTGATTFLLDEGMDTGPVLARLETGIAADETSGTLLDRLAVAGASLLVRSLDALEAGTVTAVPQAGEPSFAPKISMDDAHVDWSQGADAIDRLVRAMTPAPGAWTMLGGDRLRLLPITIVPDGPALAPGAVLATSREVLVGTGTCPVRLGEVRAPGKRQMPAADWARGARLGEGVVLA